MSSLPTGCSIQLEQVTMIIAGAIFGSLLVFTTSDRAFAFCMKPSPPYKPWSFNSNHQIDAYNREVDRYNRDVEHYRDCAARQIESYNRQYTEYLRCEARSYGSGFSGCFKPSPPRFWISGWVIRFILYTRQEFEIRWMEFQAPNRYKIATFMIALPVSDSYTAVPSHSTTTIDFLVPTHSPIRRSITAFSILP